MSHHSSMEWWGDMTWPTKRHWHGHWTIQRQGHFENTSKERYWRCSQNAFFFVLSNVNVNVNVGLETCALWDIWSERWGKNWRNISKRLVNIEALITFLTLKNNNLISLSSFNKGCREEIPKCGWVGGRSPKHCFMAYLAVTNLLPPDILWGNSLFKS